ncbi:hypothetical protein SISNIDRAFT_476134 [Sistotremastrum niveocremeum HHB9708]|uniref:Nucleoporin Nup54 alpha-helical domain-containing protein n=1 Tax=Sistotremastrum niveocremeum HHB9708 TaxID=1314777 RepID=A0A164NTK9_9AGAM|nr:hypothetical protein SISNIDRAFT_476134 [Sistotremastrum niveocremeum HHB9708]
MSLFGKSAYYFYNLVEKGDVARYGRPSNALDGARWERACRENPDPSCLVPVLAIGFDDLQKRVEGQEKLALAHQEKLKELTKSLTSLSQKHVLQNTLLLQRIQSHQTTLTHRLLRLTQHLHLLIPSIRSSSIRPEEEALRSILESIEEELVLKGGQAGGGVGGGRMRGKLNELWGVVGNLQSVRERERRRDGKSSTLGGGSGTEWSVVDEGGFQQIVHVLMEQQQGLAYLTSLLKDRARDIELIKEGIKSGKLGIPTNESGLHGARANRSTSGMSFLG